MLASAEVKVQIYGNVTSIDQAPKPKVLADRGSDFWYQTYCRCGFTLDATYTNNIVNDMAGASWNLEPGGVALYSEGSVCGFICNYGEGINGVETIISLDPKKDPYFAVEHW